MENNGQPHTAQPTLHKQASDQAHSSLLQNFRRENRRKTSWRAHGREEAEVESHAIQTNNWCTWGYSHGARSYVMPGRQNTVACSVLCLLDYLLSAVSPCLLPVRCLLTGASGSYWPRPPQLQGPQQSPKPCSVSSCSVIRWRNARRGPPWPSISRHA
jgi:hypothetical protein